MSWSGSKHARAANVQTNGAGTDYWSLVNFYNKKSGFAHTFVNYLAVVER